MPDRLYLDTARLGLMSRSAQHIEHAFVRLAGEGALTLYFREWLRDGTQALPDALRQRLPALSAWRGIKHLKQDLKQLAGAAPDSRVLVANRSAQLMTLAAKLLFDRCRNVLTTDLSWPGYQRILEAEAERSGGRVTRVALRRQLLCDGISCQSVAGTLCSDFTKHDCDGLFLPAVDNLGVQLPVQRIVETIGDRHIRFTVVDGAQALAHVPLRLAGNTCDLFLAGAHKWLCAYHPMGIAYFGNPRSVEMIDASLQHHFVSRQIDDPLLRLTEQLEHNHTTGYSETVSLLPLVTTQGALCDALAHGNRPVSTIEDLLANADRLARLALESGWRPVRPAKPMRTGICLLHPEAGGDSQVPPETMQERFRNADIAVTAYANGLVRFSAPTMAWNVSELDQLSRVLGCCSSANASAEFVTISSSASQWRPSTKNRSGPMQQSLAHAP